MCCPSRCGISFFNYSYTPSYFNYYSYPPTFGFMNSCYNWNPCGNFESGLGFGLGSAAGYGIMKLLDRFI